MEKLTRKLVEETTWREVKEAVNHGETDSAFPIGTEIETVLKNGEKAIFVVASTDLYCPGEIIFMAKDCIGKDHEMNLVWTNKGGWPASEMRRYLNEELVKLLPDDLLEVISPKRTVQILGGKSVSCEDILFLPSEYEVFGREIFATHNGEDKQFPYYCESRNRISLDSDGYTAWKWLASPYASNSTGFCFVTYDGSADSSNASTSYGVAPGFLIRKS